MADLPTSTDRPDISRHLHRLGLRGERITVSAVEAARAQLAAGEAVRTLQPVLRGSSLLTLQPLATLLTDLAEEHGTLARGDRVGTDAWLAPRLHAALRLTRREAADPGVWAFLAGVQPATTAYTRWRWTDDEGAVAPIRIVGRMNQQAIARLWWCAELFRDGADYRPVEQAFAQSELVNLCLHRPFVRNRAFALAVVDLLTPAGREPAPSDAIARFAKNVTLVMPTLSPEFATSGTHDDGAARRRWLDQPAPSSFGALPPGPDDSAIPDEARSRARAIVHHIAGLTPAAGR